MFEKGYGPKSRAKNPLEKLKGISATPPSEAELNMHMNRASFVATLTSDLFLSELGTAFDT